MDTAESDTSDETPGGRLRAFVDARWSRQQGGIRKLASTIGTTAETMYEWFRNEREPSLAHLRELGVALGVSRSRIVAAMARNQGNVRGVTTGWHTGPPVERDEGPVTG